MVKDIIGIAAVYEQLAEESAELAKAALKCARIVRGENPTPVTIAEALGDLKEKYTDMILVADELDLRVNTTIYTKTLRRWYDRIHGVELEGGENNNETRKTS